MSLDVLASIERHRLFEQASARVRLAPLALGYLAAFGAFPFGTAHYGAIFWLAVALAALSLAAVWGVPWERAPAIAQALPILAFLAVIALLRDRHEGFHSGYAPLVLVVVVWAAIFGTTLVATLTLAAAGLTIGLPPAFADDLTYPHGEFRRAAMLVLVGVIVTFVVRRLVTAILAEVERREQAEALLNQHRASEIHDDIVQQLAAAQLALHLRDEQTAGTAIGTALRHAQVVVAALLDGRADIGEPGSLRRRLPSRD